MALIKCLHYSSLCKGMSQCLQEANATRPTLESWLILCHIPHLCIQIPFKKQDFSTPGTVLQQNLHRACPVMYTAKARLHKPQDLAAHPYQDQSTVYPHAVILSPEDYLTNIFMAFQDTINVLLITTAASAIYKNTLLWERINSPPVTEQEHCWPFIKLANTKLACMIQLKPLRLNKIIHSP